MRAETVVRPGSSPRRRSLWTVSNAAFPPGCPQWSAEHESNRIRNHDSYTTPGGTIHHSPDWSATEYAPGPTYAWGFDFYYGGQYDGYKTFSLYAWAVHAGNVGAPTFGASVFRVIWFIPSRQRKPWMRQLLVRADGGLVQFFCGAIAEVQAPAVQIAPHGLGCGTGQGPPRAKPRPADRNCLDFLIISSSGIGAVLIVYMQYK